MFEEPERPLKELRKKYCTYNDEQKSFQISKFVKLLPVRDRGSWQSGQRVGIDLWLQYLTMFRIRIQSFHRIQLRNPDPDQGRSKLSPLTKEKNEGISCLKRLNVLWRGLRRNTGTTWRSKSFQICKFLKLLPERDRGTWQTVQCSAVVLWLQYVQCFRSGSNYFIGSGLGIWIRIQAGQICPH